MPLEPGGYLRPFVATSLSYFMSQAIVCGRALQGGAGQVVIAHARASSGHVVQGMLRIPHFTQPSNARYSPRYSPRYSSRLITEGIAQSSFDQKSMNRPPQLGS